MNLRSPSELATPAPMTAVSRQSLEEILRFYADAGVDDALDEVATDRFQAGPVRAAQAQDVPAREDAPAGRSFERPVAPVAPALRQPPAATVPDEAQAALARELARKAGSLEELREIMAAI
jgi:hypothetical protein